MIDGEVTKADLVTLNADGNVIIESGMQVRARIYTLGTTIDEGDPKDFEQSWLQAETVIEEQNEPPAYRNVETGQIVSESYVTASMLDVLMKSLFGICPWDEWDYKSRFNHYCNAMPETIGKQSKKVAWWKFW